MNHLTQIRTTLARATPGDWTAALLAGVAWPAGCLLVRGIFA